jgi:hypothetical protein
MPERAATEFLALWNMSEQLCKCNSPGPEEGGMTLSAPSADPIAPHSLSPAELKNLLDRERAGDPFLCLRDGGGGLAVVVLSPAAMTATIGRRHESTVSIPWDHEVSALHAQLELLAGEWTIVDDGLSRNGTFVNGRRSSGRQRLRDGDRIVVGRTILVYKAPEASSMGTTIDAGDHRPPALTDTQRRILIALCRPYRDSSAFAVAPASNQQIASELFLSVDAVKMHLRRLFGLFELDELPQNQKRARLAELVLQLGLISRRELT